MGDLADDTAVERLGDGAYRAVVSTEWEMWGPLGGYVAALALRAVAGESTFPRPISFSCHYIAGAAFDAVDIAVRSLRAGRSAASHEVRVVQGERTILEARVWSAAAGEGPEHVDAVVPDVLRPGTLEMIREERRALFPFTRNFLYGDAERDEDAGRAAAWSAWLAFQPVARFDDPWLDACRSVIILDAAAFIAATARHGGVDLPYVAPSLDLHITFHADARGSELLLVDAHSPISRAGVFGWQGDTWTAEGELVASAIGQSLWRKL